jgi:nucleotide-binding universal stress UspA family protein
VVNFPLGTLESSLVETSDGAKGSLRIRKILVPTDLSPEGERALPHVLELARKLGAEVQLLHVVEDVATAPVGDVMARPVALPGTRQELKRARELLDERKKALPEAVQVGGEALSAPSVPRAIADYASRNGFDLIALSTHGRSGFRRMIMGSVAEAVLRHARTPVLVFPRQE